MSRSWIGPGVAYLTRGLLSVIFPTASSVIITERMASTGSSSLSMAFVGGGFGCSVSGFAAYVEISQRRKVTRLGARLIPGVQGKWLGNLDKMVQRSENKYLGIVPISRISCSCFTFLSWTIYAGRDQGTWADS
ncbi:hypothetical protein DFJ58DRAFT_749553 [Suillus subalutaceus]|uniref:uncharacterized protein n=1 Tax=Suillus subalutaceus TaxID=48586 RepID=UPI001B8720BF|nr:uncharacterized protein DFJ58DRAFT_749553 [Suillus subalutaceus]KAG1837222.1 hypothetical protein DFJ58DRAFT_749553 [Suillus subalutaceus]